jgi:hypothetical protein
MTRRIKLPLADLLALLLSLTAVFASYLIADRIYQRLPHIEDEMAYVWQAEVAAHGQLTIPSPPEPGRFMVPFVVDYHSQRFGKYPPGWPALLAFGVLLGARVWVNPLLAGLAVWLTYRLGQKLLGEAAGLLAALLTLISPFFLVNSGSLLSHPWALVLGLAFTLAWLDTFDLSPSGSTDQAATVLKWLTVPVAGFSLGVLALTRPLTAVGLALPFGLHGLFLLWRGDGAVRRRVLTVGALALGVAALLFAWQFAVTGDPLRNPYTLWWKYDKIGFGPGHGNMPGGHNLHYAWINLKSSLRSGWRDLFGWGNLSWLFLPAGLWAIRKNRGMYLVASIPLALVLVYLTYWIGSSLFGPRYYFEGLPGLTLTTAAGIMWLLDWPRRYENNWRLMRSFVTLMLSLSLAGYNLVGFLPQRLESMYGLYGVLRARMQPFLTQQAQELTPAVVIVHIESKWTDYGTLLDLENPWLTSPFIFALGGDKKTTAVLAADFPERTIINYYTKQPEKFFLYER